MEELQWAEQWEVGGSPVSNFERASAIHHHDDGLLVAEA